jgi:predicted nucleic acid-binding protein
MMRFVKLSLSSNVIDDICIATNGEEYLLSMERVVPFDGVTALVAAEIMALVPNPPLRRKRLHREMESRPDRMCRWRFDVMIAATALVAGMTLIHNNADDFETIRGAIERSPGRFPKLGPLELVRCHAVA